MFNKLILKRHFFLTLAFYAIGINAGFSTSQIEDEAQKETRPTVVVAPSPSSQIQNKKIQVIVVKQYQPQGDFAILLRKNTNGTAGLLSKNIIDDGQQPLFLKASQFLLKDYRINIGEKVESTPISNLFVVHDNTASEDKMYAWPLEDFLNHLKSPDKISSTLPCSSRDGGNGIIQFSLNAGWINQLASELKTTGANFEDFLSFIPRK